MIFEREVYKNKIFYKEILTRVLNVFNPPRFEANYEKTYLPMVTNELSDSNHLKAICSYHAITLVGNRPRLDLSKCTMCLDCLSIDGVEMREVHKISDDVISMNIKDQSLDEEKSSEN